MLKIFFLLFDFSWKKESWTNLTSTSLFSSVESLTYPSVGGKDLAPQELSEEHRLHRDDRLGEKAETPFQDNSPEHLLFGKIKTAVWGFVFVDKNVLPK